MIRETYLDAANAGYTGGRFINRTVFHFLALVFFLVVSSRLNPQLSAYPVLKILGIAGALSLPAALYYLVRGAAGHFGSRNAVLSVDDGDSEDSASGEPEVPSELSGDAETLGFLVPGGSALSGFQTGLATASGGFQYVKRAPVV